MANLDQANILSAPVHEGEPTFMDGPQSDTLIPRRNANDVETLSVASEETFKPKLVFHCQLAHGSNTAVISDFNTVKELYEKVSHAFKLSSAQDVLFCTLNTYQPDMDRLLGAQLGIDDFIFAHIHGPHKELELCKSDMALGLTITDNGAGIAFVKRIKHGSLISKTGAVCIGDHIEKINGESMVGLRHYDVARQLKQIPVGEKFVLRLVSPQQSGFSMLQPRSASAKPSTGKINATPGGGRKTVRFKSAGNGQPAVVVVEDIVSADDPLIKATENVAAVLESYLGISDDDLCHEIIETITASKNPFEFQRKIDAGGLAALNFPEELVFDLWGSVTDVYKS